MTTEERLAVLGKEHEYMQKNLDEIRKESTASNKDLKAIKFKVKIICGSIAAILSVLLVVFINFLFE